MVKVQIDESIALDTYLGGCILLGVLIDKKVNIENSIDRNLTHMLKIPLNKVYLLKRAKKNYVVKMN